MMGRLRKWIARAIDAPLTGRAGGARRRRLAFEQYETRLALSAAAPVPMGDVTDTGPLLEQLWLATPGSVQWGDVSFTPVAHEPTEFIQIEFGGRAMPALGFQIDGGAREGGLVMQNARAGTSMFSANISNWVRATAFADFGGDESTLLSNVGSPASLQMDLLMPTAVGTDANYGETVFAGGNDLDSELTQAAPQGSARSAAWSPILRITAPGPATRAEGGAIDVTALVGPPSVVESSTRALAALPANGGEGARVAASTALNARAAAGGLHARAVVYEVALADDAGGFNRGSAGAELKQRVELEQRAERIEGREKALPAHPDGARNTPAPEAPTGAEETTPVAEAGERGAEQAAVRGRGEGASALAVDRALAALGERIDEEDAALADDRVVLAQSHYVGAAIALAIGATPLVRRVRRVKVDATAERSAGLK